MIKHTYLVYGFSSTHKVLAAEELLKQHDVPLKIIPRPMSLGGAECGIVIRVAPKDADTAEALFEQRGIVPTASTAITDIQ